MLITIDYLKPFYTKKSGDKLRIVFAYQYLSIKKDDEIYHFIPIEGKEINFDIPTNLITNLNEVFVFQRGNRFIRLPLYQLLLVSNIEDHLYKLIDGLIDKKERYEIEPNIELLMLEIEIANMKKVIDNALDNNDEKTFIEVTKKLLEAENACVKYKEIMNS